MKSPKQAPRHCQTSARLDESILTGILTSRSPKIQKPVTRESYGLLKIGVPTGIRTPVLTVKGWCPNRARRWGPSTESGKVGHGSSRARVFWQMPAWLLVVGREPLAKLLRTELAHTKARKHEVVRVRSCSLVGAPLAGTRGRRQAPPLQFAQNWRVGLPADHGPAQARALQKHPIQFGRKKAQRAQKIPRIEIRPFAPLAPLRGHWFGDRIGL